jgi:hypothetical protein
MEGNSQHGKRTSGRKARHYTLEVEANPPLSIGQNICKEEARQIDGLVSLSKERFA